MGHVILGLLLMAPATLYDLKKQFEAGISMFYSASAGSIRAALVGLLERGLVSVDEHVERGRNKKTYSITDAGRAEFAEWIQTPVGGRDLEVQVLSRVFFLGLLPDAASRREVVDGLIARVRAELEGLEDAARGLDAQQIPAEWREIFAHQRATLDYGLAQHRTALDWLEGHRATL